MTDSWIECDNELPPCDGWYWVSNKFTDAGLAIYDGYGFKDGNIYKTPKYWKTYIPKPKRYGKISD